VCGYHRLRITSRIVWYGREPTCGGLRGTRAKQKARIESGSCRGPAQSRMLGLDDTAALPGGTDMRCAVLCCAELPRLNIDITITTNTNTTAPTLDEGLYTF
jgi:hypothetical protein